MKDIERKFWVDYARGLALVLVIFAHSFLPWRLFEFITYIIVIFPFLSGYLYKDRSTKDVIKSRWTFLLTYYYAGAINYILWVYLAPADFKKADNLTYLKNFLLVRTDLLDQVPPLLVPLWYLVFLFFVEVIYSIASRTRTIILAIAIGIILRFYNNLYLPFKIDVAFAGLYMFEIGRLFRKKEKPMNFSWVIVILLLILILIVWYFNGPTEWNMDSYGKNPLVSIIGEIACVFIFVWIAKSIEKNKFLSVSFGKFFKFFSDNGIFILSYHLLIGSLSVLVLSLLGLNVTEQSMRDYWYIAFIIMLFSTYLVTSILPKKVKDFLTQPQAIFYAFSKEGESKSDKHK